MPRMADKIIMFCSVPIFTQVTLRVKLYMQHKQAQIKLLDGKLRTEFVLWVIIQLAFEKPKENKYLKMLKTTDIIQPAVVKPRENFYCKISDLC